MEKDSPLCSRPLQQTTALSFPGLPSWNWKVKQRFTMHTRIPHMRKAPTSGTMVFYDSSFQREDALTVSLMRVFRTLKTG